MFGDSSLLSTFILSNGQFVGLEAQDPQFNLSPMTFYTGGSITGNLTFTALPQNANQFTVYFGLTEGYSTDRQSVTFDLKP